MQQGFYFKSFLKDYKIASVAETSKSTIKKLIKIIDFSRDLVIVEYGPGTGVCILPILKKLSKNSKFIAIETNADFTEKLNKINDDRLIVVNGDAMDVASIIKEYGFDGVDIVISSIPFTFFTPEIRTSLVSITSSIINPGGLFLVYQYSPLMMKYLQKKFQTVRLSYSIINIPGIFIMEAYKSL